MNEISCVKPGAYDGFVRTTPTSNGVDLGWRIQMKGTKQKAVEIHPGNTTDQTRGCILVGTRDNSACKIKNSKAARDSIKELYGNDNNRAIRVVVMN